MNDAVTGKEPKIKKEQLRTEMTETVIQKLKRSIFQEVIFKDGRKIEKINFMKNFLIYGTHKEYILISETVSHASKTIDYHFCVY